MMKRLMSVAVMMMISVIGADLWAQSNPRYTTIVIEYIGKSNRPIFPIIISNSAEEAEWYKQKLFSDPVSSFMHVYIVQESTLEEIANIPLPKGDLKQSISGDRPRTAPIVSIILATGHDSKAVIVEAKESVKLLDEIKKRVPEYPLLVEQLSEVEGPISSYLRQSAGSPHKP